MEKITIRLEQNQFRDLILKYAYANRLIKHESLGGYILNNQILQRMVRRCQRMNALNGLITTSFTFYVYDWELCLLALAKRSEIIDTYTQITVNTITEKLHLHEQANIRYVNH